MRLLAAMVDVCSRLGYERTTVDALVAEAGVSKEAFYREFASKEECFLASFDEIVQQGAEELGEAYRSRPGFLERLTAVFETFVEFVAERPGEARLVIVDSLSLGSASIEPRARAAALFEALIGESLKERDSPAEASAVTIRAIVGGVRSIAYRALRDGRPERLADHVEELVGWGLDYRRATERRAAAARASAGERLAAAVVGEGSAGPPPDGKPSWAEPAKSPRSRAELGQRERIMRGAAQAAAERGYAALSIPAISAAAGVSNKTFYEHFGSKQEAFLAAFEALTQRAFEATALAFATREGWLEGGAAAIAELLGYFDREPLLRKLAFFEIPAAGPAGLDRTEALLEAFRAFMRPEPLPEGVPRRPPEVVIEAIAGGIWAVVQEEVVAGRASSLPDLTPEVIDLILVAFGVE